ncbi:Molybdenum cofactor sulfurase [Strongyloides ratti]|uniref:Molybdenum cofactor sulfurase n=1 Tax=Strongyloides ratti TaxID=34506 RepID=A0A090LC97_STRRB|nr:Molybdenum cofactor sulfurase [Strongyloides ratti]CEF67397.1 Molybdenum cofactor sulfurase [Strongyloides ratti]
MPLSKKSNRVYLDGAGAGIPSKWLIDEIKKIDFSLLSNPHSQNIFSKVTEGRISQIRNRMLGHFNTTSKDYSVIFTSGTTGSLKLIGETFNFYGNGNRKESSFIDENLSCFGFLKDSHTSVVGMKRIVNADVVTCNNFEYFNNFFNNNLSNYDKEINNLIMITAMSNACGKKYNLEIVNKIIQNKNWFVGIDGAALFSSGKIDLQKIKADFVVGSFYKIFGLPTGLGFLIVSRRVIPCMNKKLYYGGGTVDTMMCFGDLKPKENFIESMEDGTINFQGIITLEKCFDELKYVETIESIGRKTFDISMVAYNMLTSLKYENDQNLVVIYGWKDICYEKQGPIINFNLQRSDKKMIGYNETQKMAELFDIELRSGCFCNIGACINYLNLTADDINNIWMSGKKKCGDTIDIIDGKSLGSIRISFGKWNTIDDIRRLEKMLQYCFIKGNKIRENNYTIPVSSSMLVRILRIFLYPIKSCGYLEVDKWTISEKGMDKDRMMMIVDKNGIPITQKTTPAMCLIKTYFDKNGELNIIDKFENMTNLCISEENENDIMKNEYVVCSDNRCSIVIGYSEWLANLHPSFGDDSKFLKLTIDNKLTFANEAPFLLINLASVRIVADTLNIDVENILHRFRSNFVVDLEKPFIEKYIKEVHFCNNIILEKIEECHRCQMICIDQETGEKDANLMITLRNLQKDNSITFGIYMKMKTKNQTIVHKGEEIIIIFDKNNNQVEE